MREAWLDQLEALLAEADEATAVVTVASVAGRELELDPKSCAAPGDGRCSCSPRAATRRAGSTSTARPCVGLASELDAPERREALEDGLFRLLEGAKGLPHVSEAVRASWPRPDLAWRAYACSLLAEQLADESD